MQQWGSACDRPLNYWSADVLFVYGWADEKPHVVLVVQPQKSLILPYWDVTLQKTEERKENDNGEPETASEQTKNLVGELVFKVP